MATFSFSATSILSGAASINTSYYLLRSAAEQLLPATFRTYLFSFFRRVSRQFSSDLTIVIEEYDGLAYNHRFAAAYTYLGKKLSPLTRRIKVSQPVKQVECDVVTVDNGEEITDSFDGVRLTWVVKSTTVDSPVVIYAGGTSRTSRREVRSLELTFKEKHKDVVLNAYLPYITKVSDQIKEESKVLNLHTYDSDAHDWHSVPLTHPASFETIAMEPEVKTELIKDLDDFKNRKGYYKRVGKAWKRGYLLFGPPGTGKSSLIAAMAKYLNFDIYDLDLKTVERNSYLLDMLARFENRSIVVIEDIDRCGIKSIMNESKESDDNYRRFGIKEEITMSGLLNFIDGLWSSCGEERIIVFTTNNKEKLDPALIRPGRMDVHIEMSYCKFGSFKTLARNYLDLDDHVLFSDIENLLSEVEVSPADVAGQLMKSYDPDSALQILVKYLSSKKTTPESQEPEKQKDEEIPESDEVAICQKQEDEKNQSYKLEILVKHL